MNMKNTKNILLYFLSMAVVAFTISSCDDDEATERSGTTFLKTASSFAEGTGNGTVQIEVDGSDDVQFQYRGTATEGEDFTVGGYSNGILTLNLLDDTDWEKNETIIVRIASGDVGRIPQHTVYISSNCEDTDNLATAFFEGDYSATEWYCGVGVTTSTCDYGPYDIHLVQDETDPNKFHFDNFYDSGYDAYMVFDMAAGTVSFPNQNAGGDSSNPGISASTGTFDVDICEGITTLTINLTYDGGAWDYTFVKL
jgi:hypothetical protein